MPRRQGQGKSSQARSSDTSLPSNVPHSSLSSHRIGANTNPSTKHSTPADAEASFWDTFTDGREHCPEEDTPHEPSTGRSDVVLAPFLGAVSAASEKKEKFRRIPENEGSTPADAAQGSPATSPTVPVNVHSSMLLAAAKEGSLDLATAALRNGANPNHSLGETGPLPLHIAAQNDNVEIAECLLYYGADVNALDDLCNSALHFASEVGSMKVASLLVERGAEIDRCNDHNLTPVMVAAARNRPDIIHFLANLGADLGAMQPKVGSASHLAAAGNCLGAVEVLLLNGADPNACTEIGVTPLHAATESASTRMMSVLLQNGAKVNGVDKRTNSTPLDVAICSTIFSGPAAFEKVELLLQHGATLCHWSGKEMSERCEYAIVAGRITLVKMFLDFGCDPNARAAMGCLSLLGVAAKYGKVEIGKLLLDHKARTEDKPPALLVAIHNNQPHFVDLLLKRGANRRVRGEDDRNCIQTAALGNRVDSRINKEMIKVLITHGISINTVDDQERNTVLHEASMIGKVDSIVALLELGANVNAKNRSGMTPLMLACQENQLISAKTLVEGGGADVNCTASDGSHALCVAIKRGCSHLVWYLLSKGAAVDLAADNGTTPLMSAVKDSNAVIVQMLLDGGADFNNAWCEGKTILGYAVERANDLETLLLLIEAGVDVNQKDDYGDPPLSVACLRNSKTIVNLLLNAGAQVNEVSAAGETPLITAIRQNADEGVIKLLLDAGAKVDAVTPAGNTALHIASADRRTAIVRQLLEHGADPFIRDSNSMTALHLACKCGLTEIEEVIQEHMLSLLRELPKDGEGQAQVPEKMHVQGGLKKEEEGQLASDLELHFVCPITLEIMEEPVVAPDGHSYERDAIATWLREHGRSPMTQQPMRAEHLIPNWNLRQQIDAYLKNQAAKR